MDAGRKLLFVLKLARRTGVVTVQGLAKQPGWNKVQACRYTKFLANEGWLQNVADGGHPKYVLGREALSLAPDFGIGGTK